MMTPDTATLARFVTSHNQAIRIGKRMLKAARGQPVTCERFHRMLDQRNRMEVLLLDPDWRVAAAPLPSDRRSPADHAETARRNRLARIMGVPTGGDAA